MKVSFIFPRRDEVNQALIQIFLGATNDAVRGSLSLRKVASSKGAVRQRHEARATEILYDGEQDVTPLAKADGRSYPDGQPIIDRDIPTPAAPAPKPVAELARSSPTSLLLPYIDVKIDFDQKIYWAAMRPSRHPMITMELLQDMMCVQESVRAIMEEGNREQRQHLEYFVPDPRRQACTILAETSRISRLHPAQGRRGPAGIRLCLH